MPRQARVFKRSPEFFCSKHCIFIGPTTFEYNEATDNLLWASSDDRVLLDAIQRVKRESRMARERSEDAVSWNVFRGLELTGALSAWLTRLLGHAPNHARVHYWSFDQTVLGTWPPLVSARDAFSERLSRGSEPDIVIETDDADIWVEAKLGSGNDTTPSDEGDARRRYSTGADGWFNHVFRQSFDSLAIAARRYELLRLWLLGSYAAHGRSKRFLLVNLVRDGQEEDVDAFAASGFRQQANREFRRATWEEIMPLLDNDADQRVERLTNYLRTKTLGYDRDARLVKAFRL